MSLDEFCDWLEIGIGDDDHEANVRATLEVFNKTDLVEHISVIKGHLKHFYGC